MSSPNLLMRYRKEISLTSSGEISNDMRNEILLNDTLKARLNDAKHSCLLNEK